MKSIINTCLLVLICCVLSAQCPIDTANTALGFTPNNPAVISPGVAYSQTVQVYIPTTYSGIALDSLHIDTITNLPAGITYIENPTTGTVIAPGNGALCFSGTTNAAPGLYTLVFTGSIYSNGTIIPMSEVASKFGYSFKVEVAPIAAFAADSPACAGLDSVMLADQTTGYPTRWTWTIPGGSPATSHLQNPNILFDTAGTYTVTLIAKNSISSDTITHTIYINPSPTGNVLTTPASSDTSANGSAYVALTGGTPPFTFVWSNSATTDTNSNLIPGSYFVLVTDAKGCGYVNDNVNVSYLTGIETLTNALLARVYPNPASDVLNVEWLQQSGAELAVYDMNGQVIREWTTGASELTTFNVHNLAAGQYLLRITDKTTNLQQVLRFGVAK